MEKTDRTAFSSWSSLCLWSDIATLVFAVNQAGDLLDRAHFPGCLTQRSVNKYYLKIDSRTL